MDVNAKLNINNIANFTSVFFLLEIQYLIVQKILSLYFNTFPKLQKLYCC